MKKPQRSLATAPWAQRNRWEIQLTGLKQTRNKKEKCRSGIRGGIFCKERTLWYNGFIHIFIDKKECECYNPNNIKTYEAEIKPLAHPQRVPGGWDRCEKRNGKWTAEGGVKGSKPISFRRRPALSGRGVSAPAERSFSWQPRWYRRNNVYPVLVFRKGNKDFFMIKGDGYEAFDKTMATLYSVEKMKK